MMKAGVFHGTQSIMVDEVPKPMITAPRNAMRVTHCTLYGSDLHMYSGAMNKAVRKGDIMDHGAIGIVEQVRPDVENLQSGDRHTVPGGLKVLLTTDSGRAQN